jgi:ketosteroid isomerase-like protein
VSSERVRRILEGLEAFNSGDFEAAIADFPEDVEWRVLEQLPEQGPFRGREGVLRFWESWRESFSDFHAEVDEVLDAGDHVIVMLHMVGRGRDSGADVETPTYAQMWTFRGDEVERVRMLQSKKEALEAAGMSDP